MVNSSSPTRSRLSWLIATFFGIGHLQPGSGTWAAAVTVLLWWGAGHWIPAAWLTLSALIISAAVTVMGIPPSTVVARESGIKDPGFVVIDEVAGQMIALIGAALDWKSMVAALILFRLLDITKPFPLRRLEHLPEGTGIMLDDVGAGLYALALMQLARHFGWLA